jgi:metallo-beta-lactamase class B
MKAHFVAFLAALALAVTINNVPVLGQDTVESHKAAALEASKGGWEWMYNRLCVEALGTVNNPPTTTPTPAPQRTRDQWHAEPIKVFDNVVWLGEKEHSAWAVMGSGGSPDGIILMDAMYDYTLRDEVIDGARKMGLDPRKIRYAVMGHWHGDHAGGAKGLKELTGSQIIMGQGDWDNMEKQAPAYKIPTDKAATDGMKLTVGDETVTVYVTPGHTMGTLSSIIPVKDNGQPHTVAYWGGTMYNWINRTKTGTGEYVGKPEKFWFTQYADTAERFKKIAAAANADVILSNHTDFDGTKGKFPKLQARKAGEPHPLVVGQEGVQKYFTVVGECARAGALLTKN